MSYKLKGTIKLINETETFGSGFQKRAFVVTTDDEKYPQDIKLEILKEKVDLLDKYGVGQQVTVDFNISGNEWNDKYFVNLQAWKISSDQAAPDKSEQKPTGMAEINTTKTSTNITDEIDNLPFIISIPIAFGLMFFSLPF